MDQGETDLRSTHGHIENPNLHWKLAGWSLWESASQGGLNEDNIVELPALSRDEPCRQWSRCAMKLPPCTSEGSVYGKQIRCSIFARSNTSDRSRPEMAFNNRYASSPFFMGLVQNSGQTRSTRHHLVGAESFREMRQYSSDPARNGERRRCPNQIMGDGGRNSLRNSEIIRASPFVRVSIAVRPSQSPERFLEVRPLKSAGLHKKVGEQSPFGPPVQGAITQVGLGQLRGTHPSRQPRDDAWSREFSRRLPSGIR